MASGETNRSSSKIQIKSGAASERPIKQVMGMSLDPQNFAVDDYLMVVMGQGGLADIDHVGGDGAGLDRYEYRPARQVVAGERLKQGLQQVAAGSSPLR